jgi:hypothetical protein
MTRQELVQLFPSGNTLHIPSDGKPLPGYQQAMADYKRRVSTDQLVAAVGGDTQTRKPRTLFAALFGGGADDEEDSAEDSAPVAVAQAAPPKAEAPAAAPEAQPTEIAAVNAPVPQVRPAFAGQLAGGEVANALVPPNSGNSAEQALAAATQQQGEPQQFADLSSYHIPVPSLLGPRNAPGDAEVASNDPAAAMNAAVPTPGDRPALAETDANAAEAGQLSPAVAQALEQNSAAAKQVAALSPATVEQAIGAAMPAAKPAGKAPVQLAALAPVKSASFGDIFDPPHGSRNDVAAGIATKGGRPTKAAAAAAAEASRATVRTEPKLTQKIISQWALTNSRMEMVTKPVKAPRFVSQKLRAQPTAVYAEGFNVDTASVDPARFSGSAVNFMEVRKFETN